LNSLSGSGLHFGIHAKDVVELEIINANGELFKCSKTEKPDLFAAACCALGALGIIYSGENNLSSIFNQDLQNDSSLFPHSYNSL